MATNWMSLNLQSLGYRQMIWPSSGSGSTCLMPVRWDKQFETDAKSGELSKIADRAVADYRAGKYTEL